MSGEVDRTPVWRLGLFAAVALGIVLRLIWLQDTEYKGDQIWTFTHVQAFWETHQWPMMGMPSSVGLPNAGLSIWVFIALSVFVPLDSPLDLTRAIEVLNVVSLLLFAVFIARCVPDEEREPWWWALALLCVNPFSVLYSRCIWAQDVLAPFTLLLLWGWWYRGRWWGAFLWGLAGPLLGQIHMGGFFFAAGFAVCAVIFDRRGVKWPFWFVGSVLGALPMIPWLMALAQHHDGVSHSHIINILPIFLVRWVSIATSIGLSYSLGNNFLEFLSQPVIGGQGTYLVVLIHLVIIGVIGAIVVRVKRRYQADRSGIVTQFFNMRSPTVLTLTSALLGYGGLLSLTLRHVYVHYFVIASLLPALSFVWLARAGSAPDPKSQKAGQSLLAGLVVAQAVLTIAFLGYIHEYQVIDGDYGTAYRSLPDSGSERP